MAKTKKKIKAVTKKKAKPATKKAAKSPAKRKVASAPRKKAKSPAKKKAAVAVKKKIKLVPKKVAAPEVLKPEEAIHAIPVYDEMHPQTIEGNKKYERQFHQREDVAMNRENQKVKSAMAKRQGLKIISHTHRHT